MGAGNIDYGTQVPHCKIATPSDANALNQGDGGAPPIRSDSSTAGAGYEFRRADAAFGPSPPGSMQKPGIG
jgi:hypothetical protein